MIPFLPSGSGRGSKGLSFTALLGIVLFSGCLKDGVLPPRIPEEGPVRLSLEVRNGSIPFVLGTQTQDGAGNTIYITAFACYLSQVAFHDDSDVVVADYPASMILLDGSIPKMDHALGNMSNGHVHDIWFTAGTGLQPDAVDDCTAPDAQSMRDPQGNSIHLLMKGFVDRNGNGMFDSGADVPFEVRPSGPNALRRRHFHLHADMVEGKPLSLGVKVDVRLILLGVDLLAEPVVTGDHPTAMAVMNNFATAVSAR